LLGIEGPKAMVNEGFHLNFNASEKGFNVKFAKLTAVF
jgi:hypothetical protein